MSDIPVIGFAAYSGTGKTTLIEQLVLRLTDKGLRVAVVKHDAHRLEFDRDGKDSQRFTRAGAALSVVASRVQTAFLVEDGLCLMKILSSIRNVDLVLVEGFKKEPLTRIGVSRRVTGKGLPGSPQQYVAIVTDEEIETAVPVFALSDYEEITEFIMSEMKDFTHFNTQGRAKMVDVGEKDCTQRVAVAAARVCVNADTFHLIQSGGMKKGDVLTVAQVAGLMGAKRTSNLIPMCHPVQISGIDLSLTLDEARLSVEITASVSCAGKTGVEMEALTAVSTAALTVYDMCKAVQRDILISDIRLLRKSGGVHGDFCREEPT